MIIDLQAFRKKKETETPTPHLAGETDLAAMGKSLVQLKISLKGYHPPLWRRVLVPEDWNFLGLHQVIEKAFDWPRHDHHRFRFNYHKIWVQPEQEFSQENPAVSEEERYADTSIPLPALLFEFNRGHYEHGSHRGIDHLIELEKVVPAKSGQAYPCCIGARGRVRPDGIRIRAKDDDREKISRRLENLCAIQQPFLYDNPYEWYLVECLHELSDKRLRDMARFYQVQDAENLSRPKLILSLEKTIPDSLMAYLHQIESVTAAHLLLLMIVESPFLAPFDLNELYDPETDDPSLAQEGHFLTSLGFVFDLSEIDPYLLPSPIAEAPEEFLPMLLMPADLRKRVLAAIRQNELNALFDALQEALEQQDPSSQDHTPWDED